MLINTYNIAMNNVTTVPPASSTPRELDPQVKINIDELSRQMLKQVVVPPRLHWRMTTTQAADFIEAAYRVEVNLRYRPYQAHPQLRHCIEQLAHMITHDTNKFGILMAGVCGNGKTTLMRALRRAHLVVQARGLTDRLGMRIEQAKDIAAMVRQGESYRQLLLADILAIDDLGAESSEVMSYGNVVYPVVDLLERRYDAQRTTLATTNLTPAQVGEKYGTRLADRLQEAFTIITFQNQSFRQ